MEPLENQPPSWATALLRIIVHPEFQEEIEGDLVEKYQRNLQKYGRKMARRQLYAELFSIAKPNLIFNVNRNTMKPRDWLPLLLLPLLVAAASVAPFLPGPSNNFSQGISQFAQTIGYIGWPFVPFGLVWLIIEMRNKNGHPLNRWSNGYYPSWLTLIPVFLFLPWQIIRALLDGRTFDLWPLAIILSVVAFIIYRIQKLKKKTEYKFNPAPLYIVLIPVIAFFTSRFAVEKVAAFTREKAIVKAELLIAAIEKYKTENGEYPENLESLQGKYIQEIPKPTIMGMRAYQYEKRNSSFQLTFERLWHWNATEVVVYNTLGQKSIKGNYENYPTNHTNWWYYLAD
jgi:hypothetical protein